MAEEDSPGPLISVIIPTHNRADLLSRAVGSVRAQTYPDIEIVIVDDGSSDDTRAWITALRAEGVPLKYLRNEVAKGPCVARNQGIREAAGTYISFLDDDDAYHPRRLERLLERIRAEPSLSFVCSDYLSLRRNGTRRSHKPGKIDLQKILWMNYATQSVLALREKVQAVGGFDENLSAAQDYDLFTRLIERYGPGFRLGEVLYYYHQEHEGTRITASTPKRLWGYYQYYIKHKRLMSQSQRAWHLYRLLKIRGRKISPARFLRMVPPRFYLLELNDYFIHHTPLYLWLDRLRKPLKF